EQCQALFLAAIPKASVFRSAATEDHRLRLGLQQLADIRRLGKMVETHFEQIALPGRVQHVHKGKPARFLNNRDANHGRSPAETNFTRDGPNFADVPATCNGRKTTPASFQASPRLLNWFRCTQRAAEKPTHACKLSRNLAGDAYSARRGRRSQPSTNREARRPVRSPGAGWTVRRRLDRPVADVNNAAAPGRS